MSFTVERALQRIQAEHPGEHLPMEHFLEAIHESEYAGDPFFRVAAAATVPFRLPKLEGREFMRPFYHRDLDEDF